MAASSLECVGWYVSSSECGSNTEIRGKQTSLLCLVESDYSIRSISCHAIRQICMDYSDLHCTACSSCGSLETDYVRRPLPRRIDVPPSYKLSVGCGSLSISPTAQELINECLEQDRCSSLVSVHILPKKKRKLIKVTTSSDKAENTDFYCLRKSSEKPHYTYSNKYIGTSDDENRPTNSDIIRCDESETLDTIPDNIPQCTKSKILEFPNNTQANAADEVDAIQKPSYGTCGPDTEQLNPDQEFVVPGCQSMSGPVSPKPKPMRQRRVAHCESRRRECDSNCCNSPSETSLAELIGEALSSKLLELLDLQQDVCKSCLCRKLNVKKKQPGKTDTSPTDFSTSCAAMKEPLETGHCQSTPESNKSDSKTKNGCCNSKDNQRSESTQTTGPVSDQAEACHVRPEPDLATQSNQPILPESDQPDTCPVDPEPDLSTKKQSQQPTLPESDQPVTCPGLKLNLATKTQLEQPTFPESDHPVTCPVGPEPPTLPKSDQPVTCPVGPEPDLSTKKQSQQPTLPESDQPVTCPGLKLNVATKTQSEQPKLPESDQPIACPVGPESDQPVACPVDLAIKTQSNQPKGPESDQPVACPVDLATQTQSNRPKGPESDHAVVCPAAPVSDPATGTESDLATCSNSDQATPPLSKSDHATGKKLDKHAKRIKMPQWLRKKQSNQINLTLTTKTQSEQPTLPELDQPVACPADLVTKTKSNQPKEPESDHTVVCPAAPESDPATGTESDLETCSNSDQALPPPSKSDKATGKQSDKHAKTKEKTQCLRKKHSNQLNSTQTDNICPEKYKISEINLKLAVYSDSNTCIFDIKTATPSGQESCNESKSGNAMLHISEKGSQCNAQQAHDAKPQISGQKCQEKPKKKSKMVDLATQSSDVEVQENTSKASIKSRKSDSPCVSLTTFKRKQPCRSDAVGPDDVFVQGKCSQCNAQQAHDAKPHISGQECQEKPKKKKSKMVDFATQSSDVEVQENTSKASIKSRNSDSPCESLTTFKRKQPCHSDAVGPDDVFVQGKGCQEKPKKKKKKSKMVDFTTQSSDVEFQENTSKASIKSRNSDSPCVSLTTFKRKQPCRSDAVGPDDVFVQGQRIVTNDKASDCIDEYCLKTHKKKKRKRNKDKVECEGIATDQMADDSSDEIKLMSTLMPHIKKLCGRLKDASERKKKKKKNKKKKGKVKSCLPHVKRVCGQIWKASASTIKGCYGKGPEAGDCSDEPWPAKQSLRGSGCKCSQTKTKNRCSVGIGTEQEPCLNDASKRSRRRKGGKKTKHLESVGSGSSFKTSEEPSDDCKCRTSRKKSTKSESRNELSKKGSQRSCGDKTRNLECGGSGSCFKTSDESSDESKFSTNRKHSKISKKRSERSTTCDSLNELSKNRIQRSCGDTTKNRECECISTEQEPCLNDASKRSRRKKRGKKTKHLESVGSGSSFKTSDEPSDGCKCGTSLKQSNIMKKRSKRSTKSESRNELSKKGSQRSCGDKTRNLECEGSGSCFKTSDEFSDESKFSTSRKQSKLSKKRSEESMKSESLNELSKRGSQRSCGDKIKSLECEGSGSCFKGSHTTRGHEADDCSDKLPSTNQSLVESPETLQSNIRSESALRSCCKCPILGSHTTRRNEPDDCSDKLPSTNQSLVESPETLQSDIRSESALRSCCKRPILGSHTTRRIEADDCSDKLPSTKQSLVESPETLQSDIRYESALRSCCKCPLTEAKELCSICIGTEEEPSLKDASKKGRRTKGGKDTKHLKSDGSGSSFKISDKPSDGSKCRSSRKQSKLSKKRSKESKKNEECKQNEDTQDKKESKENVECKENKKINHGNRAKQKVASISSFCSRMSIEEKCSRRTYNVKGRVGNRGKAVSFFDADQDAALVADLAKILRQADQTIPDFLQGGGTATYRGNKYGGSDVRNFNNASAAVSKGEEPEEEW